MATDPVLRTDAEHETTEPLGPPGPGSEDWQSTAVLIARIRGGDEAALDALLRRYLKPLSRWAHGRLPESCRDLAETQDLVQVTLVRALKYMDRFEPRHEGAFLAYLRQILLNEIRAHIRRTAGKRSLQLVEALVEQSPSPLDRAIGQDEWRRYEEALATLEADEQQGIILRLELGFTHQQVAQALGKPTPDAARMLVARAMVRLTERMRS